MRSPNYIYHPPTPETAPMFAIIESNIGCLIPDFKEKRRLMLMRQIERQELHEFVYSRTWELDQLITKLCPPSADRSAALRCIDLAKFALNEIAARGSKKILWTSVKLNLYHARWQANASIARSGK